MNQNQLDNLIHMADKFDREGKFKLAEAIDNVISNSIKSKAYNSKAPLKHMNDNVKKNLLVFLIDAEDAVNKGCGGLNELFRRMRYFNIDNSIKNLGLDKVIKDMETTKKCLDTAKKDFYVMTFGKKPSKKELEDLVKTLKNKSEKDESEDDKDDEQKALDFFNSEEAQAIDSANVNLEKDLDREELDMIDDEDVSDEDLKDFMEEEEEPTSEEIEDKSENILMQLAQKIGIDVDTLISALEKTKSLDPDKLAEELEKNKEEEVG